MSKETLSWDTIPKTGLVIIMGHRGEGKSALAWSLAETLRKNSKPKRRIAAFGIPEIARKALPKWVTHVNTVEAVSLLKPSVVIIDEATLIANARRAQQENNIEWLKLIAVCRHKDHLLLFVSQHNRQLDVQILSDADWVIMKRPSLLHLRFTRKEFKTEIVEAFKLFQTLTDDSKQYAYVIDYHHGELLSNGKVRPITEMLNCSLPDFWNDKISKAYSAITIGKVIEDSESNNSNDKETQANVKQTATQIEPKRGRGRPRKNPIVFNAPKIGRGRPRKNSKTAY